MGRDIPTTQFTREDRTRYREKVRRNLAVLRELVDSGRFETDRRLCGVEMEVYLADTAGQAKPINASLLERIASADFQTELAQFNMEFSLRPRRLVADVFSQIEDELRESLNRAHAKAETLDAQVVIIGILPTLRDLDVTERNLSANSRYKALNDAILAARGEDIEIHIEGVDTLDASNNSILFEAACTSMQLHLQVEPGDFAAFWNAAQASAAPLVAVAANSPFFLGKRLHHETRIALFEQSIDTRTTELASQGVRPRVWFGEKWLEHGVFELFEENVRYFPPLLPVCDDEDPEACLRDGDIPHLSELSLHNGTVYRWNRPVYDVARGRPHLRIENRVLPAGPTVVDAVANTVFFYGLLAGLATGSATPIWERMPFAEASANFFTAARDGLQAQVSWPGMGTHVPVAELIVDTLVPLARAGLAAWDVDASDAERFLAIIERRAATGRNGAHWQLHTHRHLVDDHAVAAGQACGELVRRYAELMHDGAPVHTWPLP